MSPDVFRKLAALGLDHDQMAGVLEIMDAAAKAAADADEARKAKGRERWHRWQEKRQSNVSQHEQTLANDSRASVTRVEDNLLTKKISGKEEREEKTRVARPGFLQFWDIFPNKVGKRDAEVAFSKALQRADLETILAGVKRYAAKTDDRPWCNPTTFLNQDRWDDIPAAQPQRPATGPPRQNGRRTVMDAYHDIAREQGWTNEPTDIPGNNDDAQRLSAERGSGHEGVVVDLRRRLDGSFGSGGL